MADPTPPTTPPAAPVTPPPPTPAPTPPATPPPPPEAQVDPLVAQIAKSFDRVIEPEPPKTEPKPKPPQSTETLGDQVARIARDQEAAKVEPPPPASPIPPPAPEPPPAKKTVVKAKPPVQSQQPPAPVVSTPPPPPAPSAQPAPTPTDEQQQIARLTQAQREEYEMAVYAEAHNPEIKGRAAATLQYFKQVDAFAIEHPDSPPDSEEFREFLNKQQPKWQPGERRKIERQMIEESAMTKAREALRPDLDRLRQEQHLMRVQPIIESETGRFIATIAEDPKADELNPVSKEVAAKLSKDGYDKTAADYPVETPIIAQHVGIAREYLNLAHQTVTFDPMNQTHRWINDFVYNQGMILAGQPVEAKTRDGKVFLPLHEYAALRKANPAEADRHWTMDDKMILQMLGHNATKAVAAEIARLEGAGFKREKKLDKTPTPPPKPATPPPPSPQAQVSATPGAASPPAHKNDNAAFIDALVPGASTRILGK